MKSSLRHNAYADIVNGKIDLAMRKLKNEWTSIPYGPQAGTNVDNWTGFYAQAGGTFSDTTDNTALA